MKEENTSLSTGGWNNKKLVQGVYTSLWRHTHVINACLGFFKYVYCPGGGGGGGMFAIIVIHMDQYVCMLVYCSNSDQNCMKCGQPANLFARMKDPFCR